MIDFKRLWADADMVLKQFNANFPSSALVSELTVSEQQIIEIAKSVSLNCKLLILDEPTSSLTEKETARLFDLVKELSGRGISILYISHAWRKSLKSATGSLCSRMVPMSLPWTPEISVQTISSALWWAVSWEISTQPRAAVSQRTSGSGGQRPHRQYLPRSQFCLRRGEILGFAGLVARDGARLCAVCAPLIPSVPAR